MNYGRIRRGRMAADAFTQIKNALFRDKRLSFRDKGVFGLISTHVDGFGVSAESIAACSPTDGVSAVKTSLRNLERYGYLRRTRERRPDGTLGSAVYFITDDPELFEALDEPETDETPSSEPAVPQPTLAEPTQAQPTLAEPALAEPTVAESPHKKTNSKNPSGKNTLSPHRVPRQTAGPGEREPDPLIQKLTTEHGATAQEATTLLGQVRAEGRIANLASWACSPTGALDIQQRLSDLRRTTAASAETLPPWCGQCGDSNPAARYNPRFRRTADGKCCPDCHPELAAA